MVIAVPVISGFFCAFLGAIKASASAWQNAMVSCGRSIDGGALTALRKRLGACRVAPLYGCVDPERYQPASLPGASRAALSYLGTYAEDRQAALNTLFTEVPT